MVAILGSPIKSRVCVKVWAGFVFNSTQISPNVIPPLMIYKIRMKSGDVDDTLKLKDEVWRAQPRKKLIPPGGDLKPILSGEKSSNQSEISKN